jgi:ribosome biogenesis protein Nip4
MRELTGLWVEYLINYGNKKQKKLYQVFKPETVVKRERKKKTLKLPDGFTLFKDSSKVYPIRRQAMNYLYNRGISQIIRLKNIKLGFVIRETMQDES